MSAVLPDRDRLAKWVAADIVEHDNKAGRAGRVGHLGACEPPEEGVLGGVEEGSCPDRDLARLRAQQHPDHSAILERQRDRLGIEQDVEAENLGLAVEQEFGGWGIDQAVASGAERAQARE